MKNLRVDAVEDENGEKEVILTDKYVGSQEINEIK